MILTKTVHLKPHGTQIKYFKERGYQFTPKEEIDVKVEDLQPHSEVKVHIACDICGAEKDEKLCQYKKMVSRGGYYACSKCRQKKTMVTNQERYGGNTPFASKEVWDKALKTMVKKYGVEYATQSPVLSEKRYETNIKKYGCKFPQQNEIIKAKIEDTIEEKYGCENVSQNKEIREKVKQTMVERYGVSCSLQLPSARENATISYYKNGSVCTSKQQRYICNLYGGIINYPIGYYNIDMLIPDNNIVVEYNGGGHNLSVKIGSETFEEFKEKELKRYYYIKSKKYKQIFIQSKHDYIPQDEVLIEMLANATSLFLNEECNWVEYNIDNKTIRHSNEKNGVFYNFGNLRKIKEEK